MSFSGIARDLLIPALILFIVFAVLVAFTDLSTAVQHVFVTANITPKGSVAYNETMTLHNTYRVFNYGLPLLFTGMLTAAIILVARMGAPPINLSQASYNAIQRKQAQKKGISDERAITPPHSVHCQGLHPHRDSFGSK